MGKMEIEVKVLDIDLNDLLSKIHTLKGTLKKDCIQKLYTYDLPTINGRYIDILTQINMDYKYKTSISKLKLLFFDLDNLLNKEDRNYLNTIINSESLIELVENTNKQELVKILNKQEFINFIGKYNINKKKWIRLRQSNEDVTIAIKHVLADNGSGIQQMLETEMNVPSLEEGNNMLEQLGFYFKSYQEKRRITYKINDFEIDIDMWPLIPPYIEIEGNSKEEIVYRLNILGYNIEDTVSCTADDIYVKNGINSLEYTELILEDEKKIDLKLI